MPLVHWSSHRIQRPVQIRWTRRWNRNDTAARTVHWWLNRLRQSTNISRANTHPIRRLFISTPQTIRQHAVSLLFWNRRHWRVRIHPLEINHCHSFIRVETVASNDEGNDCNSIVRVRSIIGESPLVCTEEQASKVQRLDESIHSSDLLNLSNKSSSSTSVVHQQTEATSTVNRHRCAASKHIVRILLPFSQSNSSEISSSISLSRRLTTFRCPAVESWKSINALCVAIEHVIAATQFDMWRIFTSSNERFTSTRAIRQRLLFIPKRISHLSIAMNRKICRMLWSLPKMSRKRDRNIAIVIIRCTRLFKRPWCEIRLTRMIRPWNPSQTFIFPLTSSFRNVGNQWRFVHLAKFFFAWTTETFPARRISQWWEHYRWTSSGDTFRRRDRCYCGHWRGYHLSDLLVTSCEPCQWTSVQAA